MTAVGSGVKILDGDRATGATMTEQEWLDGDDPWKMLYHLRGKATDRKLRLVGCGAKRRRVPGVLKSVAIAELLADEQISREQLPVELSDAWICRPDAWEAATIHAGCVVCDEDERSHCMAVIRCIFGNPFRPVTTNPKFLTPTVQSLAQAIYTERAFDRLPILADALEEAGCTNLDILNHCRQPGVHARGCWALDLVLGRE
jgi:hypothetical protein